MATPLAASAFIAATTPFADALEFEKCVVRRLQAALTPSLVPAPGSPSDRIVVDAIAAMLADGRVQILLRGVRQDRFVAVLRAAAEVLSRRVQLGDENVIAELWEFIDQDDLNDMLATTAAGEQPHVLLTRMFEGPYHPLQS